MRAQQRAAAIRTDSYNYDVFGQVRSSTGSQANPFTYTGERTDASTGLEYLRARYYDAAVGSFISRDSVATPNRYAYAEGNPVVFADPSGLCVSQTTRDKFMSARNPFQAGEVHDWYQKIIAMWQNQPVCGKLEGGPAGDDASGGSPSAAGSASPDDQYYECGEAGSVQNLKRFSFLGIKFGPEGVHVEETVRCTPGADFISISVFIYYRQGATIRFASAIEPGTKICRGHQTLYCHFSKTFKLDPGDYRVEIVINDPTALLEENRVQSYWYNVTWP